MTTIYYVEDDRDIAENVKHICKSGRWKYIYFIVSLMRNKHC